MSTPLTTADLARELIAQASSGLVAVNADLLGIPGFTALVNENLLRSDGTVYLSISPSEIPVDPPSTGFTVEALLPSGGESSYSFLNLQGNSCTVTFSTASGTSPYQFFLNVQLDAAWKFSTSYPQLKGLVFDQLALSSNAFLFSTQDSSGIEKPKYKTGLNFSGNLATTGYYTIAEVFLALFQKTATTALVYGQIKQGSEGLTFSIDGSFGVGPIGLPDTFTLEETGIGFSFYSTKNPEVPLVLIPKAQLFISGRADLENSNGNKVQLPVVAGVSTVSRAAQPEVSITIYSTDEFQTSLADLGALLFGQTWTNFFTGNSSVLLSFLNTFGLRYYSIDLSLSDADITASTLIVGTLEPWTPPGMENIFTVSDLGINWQILTPLSAPLQTLLVKGEVIMFDSYTFDAAISIPDLYFSCSFKGELNFTIGTWLDAIISSVGGSPIPAWLEQELNSFTITEMFFTYDYNNTALGFSTWGNWTMCGVDVKFQIAMSYMSGPSSSYGFFGSLSVSACLLTGRLSNDGTNTLFTATWANEANAITLATVMEEFGFDELDIPEALNIQVSSIGLTYNFTTRQLILAAGSAEFGSVDLIIFKPTGGSSFVFFMGINIGKSIDLTNLPLIGKTLSALETVAINKLQFLVTSSVFSGSDVSQLNAIIDDLSAVLKIAFPKIPAQGMASTVNLSMEFDIGSFVIPISIGSGGTSTTNLPATKSAVPGTPSGNMNDAVPTTPATASDGVSWFNVQKAIGPVTFKRIGVKYSDSVLWFLLDATLTAGGLTIDLIGLSAGSPLNDFDPQFRLNGLGIDFKQPGLEIGGAFLNVPVDPLSGIDFDYAGGAVIRAGNFTLSAYGDYASVGGVPSMFIFGQVTGTFGGPPAFFVTGFSGGFGYNTSLRIPSFNEIYKFPFITLAQSGQTQTPLQVMNTLLATGGGKPWIEHEIGQYWLSAGIQFTTYSLVTTNVMALIEFGKRLQLALVGLSRARFPQAGSITYAFVELQVLTVYDPGVGVFSLTAVLSPNSYLLDPSCSLTGGFAFFMWFDPNAHKGDFVITAGGYHPSFSPPSWYPSIPKVGFSWSLDSTVSVRGAAYFALTPSAIMAGGELNVTYQDGNLKAWFKAWANMLIYFSPFAFDINFGITVGASYRMNLLLTTVTIEIELGADLHLWGPSTQGTVRVYWKIISFTIHFGAGNTTSSTPLSWTEFSSELLPEGKLIKFIALDGLAADNKSDNSGPWLAGRSRLKFSITSSVPNAELKTPTSSSGGVSTAKINIRPMQQQELASEQTFSMTHDGAAVDFDSMGWVITPRTNNLGAALWGTGDSKKIYKGDAQLLALYTGWEVLAPAPVSGYTPGAIDVDQNLLYLPVANGTLPIQPGQSAQGPQAQESSGSIAFIANEIANGQYADNRAALFTALQELGYNTITNGDMTVFADDAGALFAQEPLLIPV